jgi:uncharacterized membrane protein HdeD (DUF308 family)
MEIKRTFTEFAIGRPLAQSFWLSFSLGTILIVGGVVVLGDIAFASVVSTIVLGAVAIAAGISEIIFGFWTKGREGFVEPILLGVLYIVFGFALISEPAKGALILTFVFGLILLGSGLVRIYLGLRARTVASSVLVISGVLAILAGLAILVGWPTSGLWVIGLLLGIDLICHGVAWLIAAWQYKTRNTSDAQQ